MKLKQFKIKALALLMTSALLLTSLTTTVVAEEKQYLPNDITFSSIDSEVDLKQLKALSSNRVYNNTYYPNIISTVDANGNTGNIKNYFSSYSSTSITWKPITVVNQSNCEVYFHFIPNLWYESKDVNGNTVYLNYASTVRDFIGVYLPANSTRTIDMGTFTLPTGATRFMIDSNVTYKDSIGIATWARDEVNAQPVHAGSKVTITNDTTLYWDPYEDTSNVIEFFSRFGLVENSSKLWWAVIPSVQQNKLVLSKGTWSQEYTWTGANIFLKDLPLGVYNFSYNITNSIPNTTLDINKTITGTINHQTNFTRSNNYFWGRDSTSFYAPISVNLFYDYNKDGIQQASESSITDATESAKVTLAPFTDLGYNTDIFVNNNSSSLKVDEVGQVYSSYYGTKYKISGAKSGISITASDIMSGKTVPVNAPVFVYMQPKFTVYYDTDRSGSYSSTNDLKTAGSLYLVNQSNSSQNATVTIKADGTNIDIPTLDSGVYNYTFTPSNTAYQTVTGTITIAPTTETPDTQGYISKTFDVCLQPTKSLAVQAYYDNDYSGTYNTGDTLSTNVVGLTGTEALTTASNTTTVNKLGTYNVNTIASLGSQDKVLVKPSITISRDQMISKTNLSTLYVGIYPPSTLSGTLKDQWNNAVQGVTVAYGGATTNTSATGTFTLTVPYDVTYTSYTLSKTDYKSQTNSTTVKKTNALGTLVINKTFYTVTGVIKDSIGNLIPNAIININGTSSTTNSSGSYTVKVPISE